MCCNIHTKVKTQKPSNALSIFPLQTDRFIEMKSVTKLFLIFYSFYLLFCFRVMSFFPEIYFYYRVSFLLEDRTVPISVRIGCYQ